ncbi:unnamed protein product [Durusdinium trenchii]|uniref:Uncharacterized protein n=1 Tax=Durusdinium trenchii TaxID=1381693 RepID=A0ABP0Q8K0_9DINO
MPLEPFSSHVWHPWPTRQPSSIGGLFGRRRDGRSAASMRVAALATGLATFHHTPRGLHAGVVHAVSAACAEERPRWLRQREEVALAWKPEGWEDVRSKSRTRRKAPEPRRDFLEWAQEEWPTSAEQPRPSTKDVLPLFTLGRRNSGISLLVKCRHGQQTVMQWQKEGLIATRVALLVEGRLDDLLLRRLRERDGLEVSTLRRSEGLRHGCLSLLQVRVNSAPVEAVATLRRRFSEEGHPLRGPTGGKVTVSGLWMPQLSAAVRWGLDRFMEMMDLDAERLQRFLYQAARSHVTFLE